MPAEQQVQDEDAKRNATLEQLPLLGEQLEHFDKHIAFYDSKKSIPTEVLARPEEFMHTVAAHKLLVSILEAERGFLQTRIDSAKS
jgi:hypothetical protein